MRELKKILQDEMVHLVGLARSELKRAISKPFDSEFVGDYKLLETIVKRITVRENHEVRFTFIDGSKAKEHIAGTGKILVKTSDMINTNLTKSYINAIISI